MSLDFKVKKEAITRQLSMEPAEYIDKSPKGSIDEPIRSLVAEINDIESLVTTSSCAGRISVFLEGQKELGASSNDRGRIEISRTSDGGKGGGQWLYVTHEKLETLEDPSGESLSSKLGLAESSEELRSMVNYKQRLIHFKFEAMILHILASSPAAAQNVINAALSAGFRESGAVGIATKAQRSALPVVAVRSSGLAIDCIIGYQDNRGENILLVNETYLSMLAQVANARFEVNKERIARFREFLTREFETSGVDNSYGERHKNTPFHHQAIKERKWRMRNEGLQRQQQLSSSRQNLNEKNDFEHHLDGTQNLFQLT